MMKKVIHTPQIWTIENFLTASECQELIIFSENKSYEEATVSLKSGAKMMKNVRNNERLIYEDEKLAIKYWERLKDFCPMYINDVVENEPQQQKATGLNPRFRFYKYESNQRFKKHIDGRVEIEKSGKKLESRITFLIYLNNDFEGGETAFSYKNGDSKVEEIIIQPKAGTALCFVHEIKHEGKPVPKGTKYVLRSDVFYQNDYL
ncbi:2OG-Fe(II) oxygenase [Bernardetia sp.]|uniref:2OG-Fe(II) oxygenase n=1 Tax=Bernardetia sp. TaxID=1937974 RepID=UPI0025C33317|nr:2OG-Fe(II) oxygenase [Bernardetia sp.]